MAELQPVVMENVRILFRNFEGKEDTYNRAGDRNFSIELTPAVAEAMARDGWNVKRLRAREEGDEPGFHLPIEVSYKVRPPQVFLITRKHRTAIGEAEVAMLDWADILNVDIIINPYAWQVQEKGGIKAYLGALYVTIQENPLEEKYSDLPRSN